jgi:hypothetical protein
MGIRFQCPNGHKLNVKADLAGKRAICPSCGVRIVVPAESNGGSSPELARAIIESSAPDLPAEIGTERPRSEVTTAEPALPALAIAATPAPRGNVWYVRPSVGGQFGPATEGVFRDWIADGRVTADAYVWREGWPEWKLAREAANVLPAPLAATPIAPAPAAAPPSLDAAVAVADASPASRYATRRRRSKKHQLTLAVLMLLAVLVLAGVLAWVVRRNANPLSGGWRDRSIELARIGRRPYVASAAAVADCDWERASPAIEDVT